ncbi:hypothetical protein ABTY98_38645 [Streptomyces sp. NPDC096040]|uniref:hypothetical protein n=1 Tax=Streptomyces sp. NPDC096040 TaxID=3155541 RepID=UPI00331C48AF
MSGQRGQAASNRRPGRSVLAYKASSPQDVLRSASYRLLTTVDPLTVDVEDPGEQAPPA